MTFIKAGPSGPAFSVPLRAVEPFRSHAVSARSGGFTPEQHSAMSTGSSCQLLDSNVQVL
jgi:hypothetical protein